MTQSKEVIYEDAPKPKSKHIDPHLIITWLFSFFKLFAVCQHIKSSQIINTKINPISPQQTAREDKNWSN